MRIRKAKEREEAEIRLVSEVAKKKPPVIVGQKVIYLCIVLYNNARLTCTL